MIIIRYPHYNTEVENWEVQLQEMVIAHRFEPSADLQSPELQEHDTVITGAVAINAYLKKLRQDVADWRAPGCGV